MLQMDAAPSSPTGAAADDAACMTLRLALRLFRADLTRRFVLQERRLTWWSALGAMVIPGVMGTLQLRVGNWLHARGWRIACRLMERLIVLTTRNEMHLGSRIGPGLVLPDEGMIGLSGVARIGANCTFLPLSTVIFQSVPGAADVYGIGDHCVIGRRARIFGPVSLGAGTQVKDGSVVMTSFSRDGMVLAGIPARRRATVPLAEVCDWNPLKGRKLIPVAARTPR